MVSTCFSLNQENKAHQVSRKTTKDSAISASNSVENIKKSSKKTTGNRFFSKTAKIDLTETSQQDLEEADFSTRKNPNIQW